jgi:hypothetical protein
LASAELGFVLLRRIIIISGFLDSAFEETVQLTPLVSIKEDCTVK